MFAVLHIADFALHAVLRTESGEVSPTSMPPDGDLLGVHLRSATRPQASADDHFLRGADRPSLRVSASVASFDPLSAASPAALFSGTSKKSQVTAANPAARAKGVELGM